MEVLKLELDLCLRVINWRFIILHVYCYGIATIEVLTIQLEVCICDSPFWNEVLEFKVDRNIHAAVYCADN